MPLTAEELAYISQRYPELGQRLRQPEDRPNLFSQIGRAALAEIPQISAQLGRAGAFLLGDERYQALRQYVPLPPALSREEVQAETTRSGLEPPAPRGFLESAGQFVGRALPFALAPSGSGGLVARTAGQGFLKRAGARGLQTIAEAAPFTVPLALGAESAEEAVATPIVGPFVGGALGEAALTLARPVTSRLFPKAPAPESAPAAPESAPTVAGALVPESTPAPTVVPESVPAASTPATPTGAPAPTAAPPATPAAVAEAKGAVRKVFRSAGFGSKDQDFFVKKLSHEEHAAIAAGAITPDQAVQIAAGRGYVPFESQAVGFNKLGPGRYRSVNGTIEIAPQEGGGFQVFIGGQAGRGNIPTEREAVVEGVTRLYQSLGGKIGPGTQLGHMSQSITHKLGLQAAKPAPEKMLQDILSDVRAKLGKGSDDALHQLIEGTDVAENPAKLAYLKHAIRGYIPQGGPTRLYLDMLFGQASTFLKNLIGHGDALFLRTPEFIANPGAAGAFASQVSVRQWVMAFSNMLKSARGAGGLKEAVRPTTLLAAADEAGKSVLRSASTADLLYRMFKGDMNLIQKAYSDPALMARVSAAAEVQARAGVWTNRGLLSGLLDDVGNTISKAASDLAGPAAARAEPYTTLLGRIIVPVVRIPANVFERTATIVTDPIRLAVGGATWALDRAGYPAAFNAAVRVNNQLLLALRNRSAQIPEVREIGTQLGVKSLKDFEKEVGGLLHSTLDTPRLVLARQLFSTAIVGAGAWLWEDGILIGSGPSDPAARTQWREEGGKPYSLRTPWGYIPLTSFGAASGALLAVAAMMDRLKESIERQAKPDEAEMDRLIDGVRNTISGFLSSASEQTFIQDVRDLFLAVFEPNPEIASNKWSRMVGSRLQPVTALATAASRLDPLQRNPRTVGEHFLSRVPLLREQVPPRISLTGRPEPQLVTSPEPGVADVARGFFLGTLSPLPLNDPRISPALREMSRLGIKRGLSFALEFRDRTFNLTREQQREVAEARRREAFDFLDRLVQTPQYGTLPDQAKAVLIDRVLRRFSAAGSREKRAEFLQEGAPFRTKQPLAVPGQRQSFLRPLLGLEETR